MGVNVDIIADTFPAIVFVIGAGFTYLGQAWGVLLMIGAVLLFVAELKSKGNQTA